MKRSIVWSIEVGVMHLRCVAAPLRGCYVIELQIVDGTGSWVEVEVGYNPAQLLERATRLPSIMGELQRRADETAKEGT